MAKKIMKKAAKAVKKVAKKAVKKMAPKMPAMQAPSMQPSMGGPGAMGGGAPMMKKGGKMMKKVKKAQNGIEFLKKRTVNKPSSKQTYVEWMTDQVKQGKFSQGALDDAKKSELKKLKSKDTSAPKSMKKGGKLKKAQNGAYTMKKFKKEFPKADTMPRADLRFEDLAPLDRYDKQDQKFIMSSQRAFDTKYGKGKRATSPKKNKLGGKVVKAQNGIKKAMDRPLPSGASFSRKKLRQKSEDAKTKYNTSNSPKVEYNTPGSRSPLGNIPSRRVSIDTPGLAAGAKNFPVKISGDKGDKYYQTSRQQVKKVLKNQKMGGKTAKKK